MIFKGGEMTSPGRRRAEAEAAAVITAAV